MSYTTISGRLGVFLEFKDPAVRGRPDSMQAAVRRFARGLFSNSLANPVGRVLLGVAVKKGERYAAAPFAIGRRAPDLVVNFVASKRRIVGSLPALSFISGRKLWVAVAASPDLEEHVYTLLHWQPGFLEVCPMTLRVCTKEGIPEIRKALWKGASSCR